MDSYKSDKKVIECDINTVFSKLSNPEVFRAQLDANKDKLPEEARQNLDKLKFNADSISIESPMGEIKMAVTEKVEPTRIAFGALQSPVAFNLIINLAEVDAEHTESQTELQLDIPFFMKAMVGNKLGEGAKMFGDMIAKLPYKTCNCYNHDM